MKVFLDALHKSVNHRLPNGIGQSVYDEQGRLYGRLIHHHARYSNIQPAQFPSLVQAMIDIRNGLNKPEPTEAHRYEIVIAGFRSQRDRDYQILFSTDSVTELNHVYEEMLATLNNRL